MKLLSFVVAVLMLFGDVLPAAAPKVKPLTVVGAQWTTAMIEAYEATGAGPFSPDTPTDGLYFYPTHAQLAKMDKVVFPKMHREYIDEAWDCDDMAFEWRVLTHRWAVENITGKAPIALATFVAYVEIHSGAFDGHWKSEGRHALGLLCDSESVWWYVEPRTGLHVKVEEAKFEGTIECYKIVW